MASENPHEHNVGLAFGLNVMAGACTGIGSVVVVLKEDVSPQITGGILGLSAGVMVFVSFVDIYTAKSTEAFEAFFGESQEMVAEDAEARGFQVAMASFFGGILVTMVLDYLVHWAHGKWSVEAHVPRHPIEASATVTATSDDAEAQIQAPGPPPAKEETTSPSKGAGESVPGRVRLVKSGVITAIAIALHNFPEGLATFMAALVDSKLGAAMAVAIAIHNVPEGMAVALPIFKATGSRWKAIVLGTLSGLTEPLGGLVGYLVVINTGMSNLTYAILFGTVAGMMVYISIEELLPLALKYDTENKIATKMFHLGMAIIGLSLVLFTI